MSRRIACVATCNLNQWAMDFEANLAHIKASILKAKRRGARYRVGPELEICGYGCEDHFFELDTVSHSWEALADLVASGVTDGILCDVGMPVMYRGVLYNCRVFLLNSQVLLIRPKLHLANDGNYRETRYFAAWKHRGVVERFALPPVMADAVAARCGSDGRKAGPVTTAFGDGVLQCLDTTLAAETCEELFTPQAPHISLALAGVEIISNGSGSHHQLRKLDQRLDLIRGATAKAGGVYLYANQRGCDGGRMYFDGCASVAVNGEFVAQGAQFALEDVEVVTAHVDLDDVVSFRGSVASLREQASTVTAPSYITADFRLCRPDSCYGASACAGCADAPGCEGAEQNTKATSPSLPIQPRIHLPEEEIAYGPACWLWDYLRRSGGSGYLIPLSGGADSASSAAIVGTMCQMVKAAINRGDQQVLQDARRIGQYEPEEQVAPTSQDFANRVFVTVYMGTVNSSQETKNRAAGLAKEIGAYHLDFRIDSVVEALVALFATVMGKQPAFRAHGGSNAENLALQNIQARLRMVIAFLLAQLVPWVRNRRGFLLVLGSANVDECLRGYLTKYDCSSADVNPIGGISKQDLRRFLRWGASALGYPSLQSVLEAVPTAELEPGSASGVQQTDEVDMGITYEELSLFGRLRKVARAGPASAYLKVLDLWRGRHSPETIAAKVKHFFTYYAINRHKTTVLTPAYHAESYSPDDNRFDHRQFLYNFRWPWQFKKIDELVARS